MIEYAENFFNFASYDIYSLQVFITKTCGMSILIIFTNSTVLYLF